MMGNFTKGNVKFLTSVCLLLILFGCSNNKLMKQAYLSCYPLETQSKKSCVTYLNNRYIQKDLKANKLYVNNFQYQAEKEGFRDFIKKNNFPCVAIDNGPIFFEAHQAYFVKCKANMNYFVRFNYNTKNWEFLGPSNLKI